MLRCDFEPFTICRVGLLGFGLCRLGIALLDNKGAVVVQTSKKKAEELLGIFLRASLHVIEARQTSDGFIDVVRCQRVAKLLQLFRLQTQAQLLDRTSRVDDLEVSQKHYHCINKRGLRLEAVYSALCRLVKEIIKGRAKEEYLENLLNVSGRIEVTARAETYRVHVAKIASVYKATRFDEGNLLLGFDGVGCKNIGKRIALWWSRSVCVRNAIRGNWWLSL